jgi:protocatechuate 3,4-dioxygenase beta subunit
MKVKMFGCSLQRALVAALVTVSAVDGVHSVDDGTSPFTNDVIACKQYNYTPDRRHLQDDDETIVLFFHGTVVNDLWEPITGAQIQFWQTDKFGVYNHPQDLKSRGYPPLQPDFQYFGTATSDTNGSFDFITYRPGIYPSRPITHIHYKVFQEGQELLTSQFYFADEGNSEMSNMMVLDLVPVVPQSSDNTTAAEYFRTQNNAPSVAATYFQTSKTIVVDLDLGGTLATTPPQTEGPFYPVVDFFHMGNDLTRPDTTPPTESPGADPSTTVPSNGTNIGTSSDTAGDHTAPSSATSVATFPSFSFVWMLSTVIAGVFGLSLTGIILL